MLSFQLINCGRKLGFPRDVPGQSGTGRPVVPLSQDKKISLSHCPFVPGQGQEQKSWEKLLCPGMSREVLGQNYLPKNIKKQEIWSFFFENFEFILSRDGPGQRVLSQDICSCP